MINVVSRGSCDGPEQMTPTVRLRKSAVAAIAALPCRRTAVAVDPQEASADNVPEFGFASLTTLASRATVDIDACAAQVKNVGASWVRLVVAWNLVEPNRGQFNWGTVDAAVLAARANGTKVLLLTGPAPIWAQGLPGNPLSRAATPADPATFGQFAAPAPFFLFTVRDLSTDPTKVEANFGVFGTDSSPKPAGYAIAQHAAGTTPPTTTPTTTLTTAPRPPTSAPGTNVLSVLGEMFGP